MTDLRLISSSGNSPKWQTLTFQGHEIRYTLIQDEPWFVASDVCAALGIGNVSDVLSRLDKADIDSIDVWSESQGRHYTSKIVNESGLYDLILDSRKPEAREFRKWVTSEVLPSIRKTGSYGAIKELTRRDLAQMVIEEADRADKAEAALKEAKDLNHEAHDAIVLLEPQADAWKVHLSAHGDLSVGDIAKEISRDPRILPIGRNRLFDTLASWKWIYRGTNGDWHIYQEQIENGRLAARGQSHPHPHTGEEIIDTPQVRVTTKGLNEIRRRLLIAAGHSA